MRHLLLALLAVTATPAFADLQLQLPEPEWLLTPAREPIGQREALIQPRELSLFQQLRPLIEAQDYAGANDLLSEKLDLTVEFPYATFSPAMNYVIGQIYLSTGQIDAAEDALLFAIGQLPDYVRAHQALGFLYLRAKRFDEARPHIAKAVELGGFNAELFGYLGYLNQETENFTGAVSAYQQAVMLDDSNEQWQQGLLYSMIYAQEYRPALALIAKLLEKHADDSDLWLYRANLFMDLDDRRRALESIEVAIRLGEDTPQNLRVASQLHLEEGSLDRAVELMEMSSTRGVDSVYLNQMAAWLVREERWDYARRIVDAARSLWDDLSDTERSVLLVHEAAVFEGTDRTSDAIDDLEQATSLDPANPQALVRLGDLYSQSGRAVQAEMMFDRATAYPDVKEEALLLHARMAIDSNDYDKALDLLREVAADDPTRFDVLENIRILQDVVTARQ